VFHLHRLDDRDDLSGSDRITGRDADGHDNTLEWRHDLGWHGEETNAARGDRKLELRGDAARDAKSVA
jgi:hypothetical protein